MIIRRDFLEENNYHLVNQLRHEIKHLKRELICKDKIIKNLENTINNKKNLEKTFVQLIGAVYE